MVEQSGKSHIHSSNPRAEIVSLSPRYSLMSGIVFIATLSAYFWVDCSLSQTGFVYFEHLCDSLQFVGGQLWRSLRLFVGLAILGRRL